VEASAAVSPTSSSPTSTTTSAGQPPTGGLAGPPSGNLYQPAVEPVEPVVGDRPSGRRHDGRYQRRYDRSDADSPSRFPGVNPNRGPPDS
jgi:hypothetical protein